MDDSTPEPRPRLVVIGNGMAGARLLEDILAADPDRFELSVIGDEPYGNYNRILLSNVLNGTQEPREIFLNPLAWYEENGITLHAGARATAIDRAARTVRAGDRDVPYDVLILATGSRPFVPPIAGTDKAGVFVFRTLDDCHAIAARAGRSRSAVVLGGGLLGLEAARGLLTHDVDVTVVEVAPHLMAQQLDAEGGAILRAAIERMGIAVKTGVSAAEILGDGEASAVRLADGTEIPCDLVVISCGIRPNAELARDAGLEVNRGIVVDDRMRTVDPAIFSVGECAEHRGQLYGLVAPLWEQTRVLADLLTGKDPNRSYAGSKLATKLKVMGVEVAGMGRLNDPRDDDEVLVYSEPAAGIYKKVVVRDGKIHGACVVGDLEGVETLMRAFQAGTPAPARRAELLFPAVAGAGAAPAVSLADLPDEHQVCDCNGVSKKAVCDAIRAGKCTVQGVGKVTRAGTGCGSCKTLVKGLIEAVHGAIEADPADAWYVPAIPLEKSELVAEVRRLGLRSVSAVLDALGRGPADEKSLMGLASLLKSLWGKEYVDERDARFVNDRVHANIQKDGTFSVVPRIFGGVTSAEELIRIGEVARKYDVPMVKITGGQRIDLLGIAKERLPDVWRDLGMPSGHAYTKAFRTCKTCVGSEFCRFGTNDSTGLGIAIERRFQGWEFPAKVKMAVSGCPRNCAESTVKDVGVIATEGGEWEISLGGAAGASVRKTDILCRVRTREDAIRIIGRFLIYYRDHAKWLERTYDFVPRVGIDRLRAILLDDAEGLAAYLDAEADKAVEAFVDPWLERDRPAYSGQFEDARAIRLPVLDAAPIA